MAFPLDRLQELAYTNYAMRELIAAITEWQKRGSVSDRKFSRDLGFDDSYWRLIKAGKARPSQAFLRALAKAFPEHRDLIGKILLDKDLEAVK